MKEFDHPHVAKLVGESLLGGGKYKIGLKLCPTLEFPGGVVA